MYIKYNWNYKGVHCGVYQIINTITNQQYIGISNDILGRWRHHIYASQNQAYDEYNYPLMQDLRKYGWEKFQFIILEECSSDLLSEKEKEYITLYQPEYNHTIGGRGGNQKEPTFLSELFQDLKQNILSYKELADKYGYSIDMIGRINRGICWKQSNIIYPIRTAKDTNMRVFHKEVIQIDKKTNQIIKCWYSATEAALSLGITDRNGPAHINQCCKGQRKTAYEYKWQYPDSSSWPSS